MGLGADDDRAAKSVIEQIESFLHNQTRVHRIIKYMRISQASKDQQMINFSDSDQLRIMKAALITLSLAISQ